MSSSMLKDRPRANSTNSSRPRLAMLAKRLSLKAQDSVEEYGNEVEQLRDAVSKSDEEKQRLEHELAQVKDMLQREVSKADVEGKRSGVIIAEYKQICQRLEDDYNNAKTSLIDLRTKMSNCEKCSCHVDDADGATPSSNSAESSRSDPILSRAQERVRELELELAQTKLAHVEAQCKNQDLTHQLHATASELQAAKNSWPWLSKTLSSIKEATNKKDNLQPGNIANNQTTNNFMRRDSAPVTVDMRLNQQHAGFKEAI